MATLSADFEPVNVADQPICFDGTSNAIDCGLTLKAATKRAHAFNRRQLRNGLPVKEWAFVVACCREVPTS